MLKIFKSLRLRSCDDAFQSQQITKFSNTQVPELLRKGERARFGDVIRHPLSSCMDDGAHRAGGFGFLAALKNMESLASLLSYLLLLPYSFCSFASKACFSRVLELAPRVVALGGCLTTKGVCSFGILTSAQAKTISHRYVNS